MPVSVAEFLDSVCRSAVLSADVTGKYAVAWPAGDDAAGVAAMLVRDGVLTPFQADHVYAGKAASLVLGPYVVLDMLGQGGMGVVYKAQHRRMRRIVALKVIAKSALPSDAAVRRFEREAQAAARLEHPNIVTAFDAGEVAGMHYLVMQFVDGRNLSDVVKDDGPQSVAKAVGWVLQAARGLAYAHDRGVVHRDVKPANLLIDGAGTVKVLDMGLARVESLDAGQDQLTGTGQIMGTVDYMAPEQAVDTRRADARSDVYSLGATLWYLLTGRPLFAGETAMIKLMAHINDCPPSLLGVRPDVPEPLDGIFQKMVAKSPGDRFQSMQAVIAALGSVPYARDSGLSSVVFGEGGASLGPLGVEATCTLARPEPNDSTKDTAACDAAQPDRQSTGSPPAGVASTGPTTGRRPIVPVRLMMIGCGVVGFAVVTAIIFLSVGRAPPRVSGASARSIAAASARSREPTVTVVRPHDARSTDGVESAPSPAVSPFSATAARKHQEDWAHHLGIEVETTNSIGQTLIVIPPGRFSMGEGGNAVAVTLTKPFLIGQTEVTQGQWKEVMGTEPWKGQQHTIEGSDVAATFVSWNEAVAFCEILTGRERDTGTISREQQYRLPTEAEWEFACRAGTLTAYSFGDDESRLGDFAWYGSGSSMPGGNTVGEMYAHAVGLKKPNPFGLLDMHGNVWEWVSDWYGDSLKATHGPAIAVTDPQGPGEGTSRVDRGGCWFHRAPSARSAVRSHYEPFRSNIDLGFRLVLAGPPGYEIVGFYGLVQGSTVVRTVEQSLVQPGDSITVNGTGADFYDGEWTVLRVFRHRSPDERRALWSYEIKAPWQGFPPGFDAHGGVPRNNTARLR